MTGALPTKSAAAAAGDTQRAPIPSLRPRRPSVRTSVWLLYVRYIWRAYGHPRPCRSEVQATSKSDGRSCTCNRTDPLHTTNSTRTPCSTRRSVSAATGVRAWLSAGAARLTSANLEPCRKERLCGVRPDTDTVLQSPHDSPTLGTTSSSGPLPSPADQLFWPTAGPPAVSLPTMDDEWPESDVSPQQP